jgi:hypothetical protein
LHDNSIIRRTIHPVSPIFPWLVLAFASAQVVFEHDLDHYGAAECAMVTSSRYAGQLSTIPWTHWSCKGKKMLQAQYHVRYMSPTRRIVGDSSKPGKLPGLCFLRLRIESKDVGVALDSPLFETRLSVAILTSVCNESSYYNIVTLTDDPEIQWPLEAPEEETTRFAVHVTHCAMSWGVSNFQLRVGHMIMEWGKQWHATLDSIQMELDSEVR